MTPEAQRIAIAIVCGITRPIGDTCYGPRWYKTWINSLPDYLNDLDAINEAVHSRFNNSKDSSKYAKHLFAIVCMIKVTNDEFCINGWSLMRLSNATAAQKCEAFLKATNKWRKDDPNN